jgi:hypothetical protein
MQTIELTLRFDRGSKGYIAHPYWPDLEKVINIQKSSGCNRARSEKNRAAALSDYLAKIGMTLEEYQAMEKRAARQFYRLADVAPDARPPSAEEIVIPEHHVYGCLTAASDQARSGVRICDPTQLRSMIVVEGPLMTGKTAEDGWWERFAVVTAGTGAKLSNQRALRRNAYIRDFRCRLRLSIADDRVDLDRVRAFVAYAGREVGIGASRKMGWGRFTVE